jgi:hypothetical protein
MNASTRLAATLIGAAFTGSISSLASATVIYPVNNGFEVPDLTGTGYTNAYEYNVPSSVGTWTFTGGSGVANNSSGFGVAHAPNDNSDGATSTYGQAAFIQGIGTISQTITGVTGGTVSLTFLMENRGGDEVHPDPTNNPGLEVEVYNPIDVTLVDSNGDSTDLGTYSPPAANNDTSTFQTVTTSTVDVAGGTYTVEFTGTNSENSDAGGVTSFIDSVQISNAVPEPASIGLLSIGALGLLSRRRKM